MSLNSTRADLYRSILEGVGFGIRHNIDTMREEGVSPKRILAVGGGIKNPLWMQIVSDIAGIDQYIPDQRHGASYGDAFLAGVGVGLFSDTSQVVDWVDYSRIIRHDPIQHKQYQPYYELYRQVYLDTADSMHDLVRLEENR
jgi:xylulokinase